MKIGDKYYYKNYISPDHVVEVDKIIKKNLLVQECGKNKYKILKKKFVIFKEFYSNKIYDVQVVNKWKKI